MPALIVDGMQYERNEVPVFLAQFYRLVADETTGEVVRIPTDPTDIKEIRFTHSFQHSPYSEHAFEPVEGLEKISVPLTTLHESEVDSPDVFAGTTTVPFGFHFIFVPGETGSRFYPKHGAYRTVFEFMDADWNTIETVTYRSECGTIHGGSQAAFGEVVRFLGEVWTKKLDPNSGIVTYDNSASNVLEVYRTISLRGLPVTDQNRIPIGADRIKIEPAQTAAAFKGSGRDFFPYNFEHTFATQELPGPGDYLVRFEFEHTTPAGNGVAEISLKLS